MTAVVAAVAACAFLPSLHNGFVDLDDQANIVTNPWIRDFAPASLRWMFTTFHLGHWQPLSWLTIALDHGLWGLDAAGHHLTSLLLHAANAALVFQLAMVLLGAAVVPEPARMPGAALAALLWALHPLRVESVAWATERRDVLSAFFTLVALLAYTRAPGRRSALAAALGATVLALLAKASAMVVPAFLLVLDVYPLRRLGGRAGWIGREAWPVWLEKLPFVLLAAVAAAIATAAQRHAGALRPLEVVGIAPRIGAAMFQSGFYLWTTLWPQGLLPMYEYPIGMSPAHPSALAGAGATLAIGLAAVLLRRRCPGAAAAYVAYLAAIAPTSGFAQSGPQVAADRYTYLASIGWSILAGGLAVSGAARPWARVAAAGPLLVLLSILTARQTATWRDARTLWSRAAAIDPNNAFAQKSLGDAAREAGDLTGAVSWYRKAVTLRPYAEAETNLAAALESLGRTDEALVHHRRALAADPRNAFAYTSYGVALADRGERAEAIELHRRAIALDPDLMEAHANLGSVLDDLERYDEAFREYETALALRPAPEVYNNLGVLLLKTGRPRDAVTALRRGLALRPGMAVLHETLGHALRAAGDRPAAIEAFETALRLDPGLSGARQELAALRGGP